MIAVAPEGEPDKWLGENKAVSEARFPRGMAEMDRGEGIADCDVAS
jgi:hypothetical protein